MGPKTVLISKTTEGLQYNFPSFPNYTTSTLEKFKFKFRSQIWTFQDFRNSESGTEIQKEDFQQILTLGQKWPLFKFLFSKANEGLKYNFQSFPNYTTSNTFSL